MPQVIITVGVALMGGLQYGVSYVYEGFKVPPLPPPAPARPAPRAPAGAQLSARRALVAGHARTPAPSSRPHPHACSECSESQRTGAGILPPRLSPTSAVPPGFR